MEYFSATQAKKILNERRKDVQLVQKVTKYLGSLPGPFSKGPRLVLARQVATPTLEFFCFAEYAETIFKDMSPLCLELLNDYFDERSSEKKALVELYFARPDSSKERDKSHINILEEKNKTRSRIFELKTSWGQNLVEFHHKLAKDCLPRIEFFDASSWTYSKGATAKEFYSYFFTLFVVHGILVESYGINKDEEKFVTRVVDPAIEKVRGMFGVDPLIVRLLPEEIEAKKSWDYYPAYLRDIVSKYKEINV